MKTTKSCENTSRRRAFYHLFKFSKTSKSSSTVWLVEHRKKFSVSFLINARNNTLVFSSYCKLFSKQLQCMILVYNFKEILNGFLVSRELRKHRWNSGTGCVSTAFCVLQTLQECFNKDIKIAISSIQENVKNIIFAISRNCDYACIILFVSAIKKWKADISCFHALI